MNWTIFIACLALGGVVYSNYLVYRKTKLELHHKARQKRSDDIIETFSALDKSSRMTFRLLTASDSKKPLDETPIHERDMLLAKLKLLLWSSGDESKEALDIFDTYQRQYEMLTSPKTSIDINGQLKHDFDVTTNRFCEALGGVIQKNNNV